MTVRAEVREFVAEQLTAREGREEALTLRGLSAAWAGGGRPEVAGRELRQAIAELVREGLPIVGDSSRGYYLAATSDELRWGYRELRGRALAMLERAKRLMDSGRHRLGRQQTLDLRYEQQSCKTAIAVLEMDEEEGDE